MGLKGRKRLGELPDPSTALRQGRARLRRLLKVLDAEIERAEGRGTGSGRLKRLRERRVMAQDEIARLERALDALADRGTPYQFRVPKTKERVRLYRRKKRR